MRRFYKIMFILCFAVLCTFIKSDGKAYAAWNNNAYDFYHNTSGVRDDNNIPLGPDKLLIKDGSLWYCQRGVASSAALRYRIIGHKITYRNGNSTYTIHSPLNDGITRVVDSKPYWHNGIQYAYDLWEIKYQDVYKEFIRVYGAVDAFSPLVNNHSSVELTVDTYVTTLRNGVTLGGSVDRSGSMSGVVFYQQSDYNRFLSTGLNISLKEWNEMYNISCIIPPGKKVPAISIDGVYVSSPRNSIELYSPNGNFTDKVYVKTGKDLTIRYDARLSYALDYYGMHATFWDTTDFFGNASGTLAMDSKSNDWTISFTNNKWYAQLNGSFRDKISSNFKTNVKRHSRTLVTTDLTFNFPTEETYNFYPRVMTFYANRYDESNYQPRMDFNPYHDPSKRLTVVSDGTAPTISKVEIKNISTAGFDVYVYDVVDNASGVREVRVPVWTKADQSDIIWYSAVSQGNGVYKASIKTDNHGNNRGTYVVHTYTYDNVNNSACVDTRSVEVGNKLLAGITIEDYEYLAADGTIWVQNNNVFSSHITADARNLQSDCHIALVAQTSYRMNASGGYQTYTPADFLIPNGMRDGQISYSVVKGGRSDTVSDPLPSHKIDTKTSYIQRINARSFYGYAEQWLTEDLDMEFNALIRVEDSSNKVVEQTGFKDHKVKLKSDGDAPTGSGFSSTYTVSNDSVSLKISNVTDTRSGVDEKTVYALIYPKSNSSKAVKVSLTKGSSGYSALANLKSLKVEFYGDMVVEYYATDNVGNEGKIGVTTFKRIEPKPISNSIEIKDYEYKDPNTGIKWVQVGNEFSIEQLGSGPSLKPTNLYVYFYDKDYTKHFATLTSSRHYNAIDLNHNDGFTKSREFTMQNYPSIVNGVISNYYLTASKSLNGNIYRLKHQADIVIDSDKYWSDLMESSEYLGIDAAGPKISWEQTGRNEITVTTKDDESGLNKVIVNLSDGTKKVIDLNGNNQSVVIDLGKSNSTTITVTDNVGNSNRVSIGDIATRVESSIVTQSVLTGGRKKLKVTVTAKVINPIPKKTMTLRIKATGDGVPVNSDGVVKDLYVSDSNPVTYEFYVDDIYNTPNGPLLSYSTSDTEAGIAVGSLSDIVKNYTFTLESRYELIENSWKSENKTSCTFASGFDHFKYTLEKLSDSDFNLLPNAVEIAKNKKVNDNFVSMKYLPTGRYRIIVTMYDYNGNPSGTTTLEFDHNQPSKYGQLDLNVTAVKDIAWKSANYPFNYKTDASKFPLGSSFRFNNNPIKLGYALNFNIDLIENIPIERYEIKYDVYGKDSAGNRVNLKMTLDGKDLSYYDTNESTNYLSQTDNFTVKNNKLYVKHYLPASLQVRKADGSAYTGQLYVDAKLAAHLNSSFDIGQLSGTYNLYSVVTSETAIDDLELDKQR